MTSDTLVQKLNGVDAHYAAERPTVPRKSRPKPNPDDAMQGQEAEAKSSAATKLADLLMGTIRELWHTPTGEPFATYVDKEAGVPKHIAIYSSDFAELAQRLNYVEYSTAIAADAVKAAINTVAAAAKYAGGEYQVHSRIAHYNGAVYVDQGDDTWSAVRIDRDGWKIVPADEVPVKFRRLRTGQALPDPQPGGSIDQLRSLFKLDDTEWMLLVGWLIGCFQETGGRALLELIGQQGSGKSTLARYLVGLIDPSEVPVRSMSRDEEALLIAVLGKAVLAFDNLSSLAPELADALCRLSTGGGIGKRKLYSDSEEILFKAQLPLIWTSIIPVAISRPDLQDRTITVRLASLEGDTYRPERAVEAQFEAMRPQILGALYTAISACLVYQDHVHLDRLPRLADFATWVEAAGPALNWEEGEFAAALESSSLMASAMAVDNSPVANLVISFMQDRPYWEGSASMLLPQLKERADDDTRRQRSFPKDSARLGIQLRRMQRPLSHSGVSVRFDRTRRSNMVILTRNDAIYDALHRPETVTTRSEPVQEALLDSSNAKDWAL